MLNNISEFRTDIFDGKEDVDFRKKVCCLSQLPSLFQTIFSLTHISSFLLQIRELEEATAARESKAWDGHTATARSTADTFNAMLTPEERAKDALRRRGLLVEGQTAGVYVPEGMSLDRQGFIDDRPMRAPNGELYPDWFVAPSVALAQQQQAAMMGATAFPTQQEYHYQQQTEQFSSGGYDASWFKDGEGKKK